MLTWFHKILLRFNMVGTCSETVFVRSAAGVDRGDPCWNHAASGKMVVNRDIQQNFTNRSQFTPVHGRGDPAWSMMKRSAAVLCGTGALSDSNLAEYKIIQLMALFCFYLSTAV